MTGLTVRTAEKKDIDAIRTLEEKCFTDPWGRKSVEEETTMNSKGFYLVAENDGKVVGYAGMWKIGDEGHITRVAVDPQMRQRKVGSAVIEGLTSLGETMGIREYTLEVGAGNTAAIGLYEKYGFKTEGLRKEYYAATKEDALIMWRRNE